jgi:branched-chain amino acid transport system ATP-binding protein
MEKSVNAPPDVKVLLSLQAISKRFGNQSAISDLSLCVRHGEIIGVFGDRGSGKANIIHLLAGEIAPSAGRIWFDGDDVTHLSPELRVRRGIARSAEPGSLFSELTAVENVLIQGVQHHLPLFPRQGGKTYVEEAGDLLDAVGLKKYADVPVGALSPARQRLVAIAIGLASKPSLLVVDGTGISGQAAGVELSSALTRLASRRLALLFISSDLTPVLDICDRVVVLHGGTIIARGVPNRAVAEPLSRRAYQPRLQ